MMLVGPRSESGAIEKIGHEKDKSTKSRAKAFFFFILIKNNWLLPSFYNALDVFEPTNIIHNTKLWISLWSFCYCRWKVFDVQNFTSIKYKNIFNLILYKNV